MSIVAKEDLSKQVIDEYYTNGFNKTKAVQTVFPDIAWSSANVYYHALAKESASYIAEKITVLRATTQIKAVQVLRELINFSYSDITDYMDLTVDELKALPADLRRCIHSFERKKTTYLPRGAKKGEEVTDEIIKIKLFDKVKTLEMINKHIGFYSEDNKQKAANINLTKVDKVTLNALIQAIE